MTQYSSPSLLSLILFNIIGHIQYTFISHVGESTCLSDIYLGTLNQYKGIGIRRYNFCCFSSTLLE